MKLARKVRMTLHRYPTARAFAAYVAVVSTLTLIVQVRHGH